MFNFVQQLAVAFSGWSILQLCVDNDDRGKLTHRCTIFRFYFFCYRLSFCFARVVLFFTSSLFLLIFRVFKFTITLWFCTFEFNKIVCGSSIYIFGLHVYGIIIVHVNSSYFFFIYFHLFRLTNYLCKFAINFANGHKARGLCTFDVYGCGSRRIYIFLIKLNPKKRIRKKLSCNDK